MKLLWELILKDLRLFVADRKAMIISFAVPIAIASFMAMLMGGSSSSSGPKPAQKVEVYVVDQDQSEVSKSIVAKIRESESLNAHFSNIDEARKQVESGKAPFAVIMPAGFGEKTKSAFAGGEKGEMQTITDPSKNVEAQIAKGWVMQAVMSGVAKSTYGGKGVSEAAFESPFVEKELGKPKEASDDTQRSATMAHAFIGMAMQGLFFWAIEAAMGIMRERREGIWRRLRAAPVAPSQLLLGKILSGAIRAMSILVVVFGFGVLVFRFGINGSILGFAILAVTVALMTSAFGLFVAALGKTEQQSRGLSILAVLTMMMLGGAWFPSFMMPGWVQKVSMVIPVRWAVDGLDSMTWRAQGLSEAFLPTVVLLGFTLVFAGIAFRRMSWDIEA